MVPDDIANSRWGGQVDAHLEGIRTELMVLKPLPGTMGVLVNKVDSLERAMQRVEAHDQAVDEILDKLCKAVDKGNSRRAWLALWSPVFVALISVAGVLLARGGGP